jgi:hypothetical protein
MRTRQGCYIAPSDRGPLLVEVNYHGNLDLYQLADGEGIADDRWRRFVGTSPRRH